MPGYNHYPDCTCGWCQGGGGQGGGSSGRNSNVSQPPAATRTIWDGDGCCYSTTCPICGTSVFFVRHNGGSVWFDSLGKPWPKHGCFFEDGYGARLRTRLARPSEGTTASFFGVVTETVVTKPGESGRIIIQCSDSRVIDDQFNTTADLTRYPGALVVVEERERGRYRLHRIDGDDMVIEVWNCPRLGYVLVYDPSSQRGVKETESRFWVWDEKRWTTLCDYNIQPLLAPLESHDATRIAYEYLEDTPVPPPSTAMSGFLRSILAGKTPRRSASSIPAVIFPGTPYERRFMVPGVLRPERVADWVREVEAIRRSRNVGHSGD